jgi:hypothetical protein
MTFQPFLDSLKLGSPPEVSDELKALWYDAKGDWAKAHDLISQTESKSHCLIHAYLHRKEGDIWNADYWYRKADTKRKDWSLKEEWESLVKQFLPAENQFPQP